jgi:hypothetical protein
MTHALVSERIYLAQIRQKNTLKMLMYFVYTPFFGLFFI